MSFLTDLNEGNRAEELTIRQLERVYPRATLTHIKEKPSSNNPHPTDIIMEMPGWADTHIDAKWDKMSGKTGNICVEEATLAKGNSHYLFYLCNYNCGSLYLFKTEGLLKKLEALEDSQKIRTIGSIASTKGGTKRPHKIFLIPANKIESLGLLADKTPYDEEWLKAFRTELLGQ